MRSIKPRTSHTGYATYIERKGISFLIFSSDPQKLERIWVDMTESIEGFSQSECRKVELRRIHNEMKKEQKPKKPRAHNHIPASHREKLTLTQGISQDELAKAKAQAARFLSKMS
jgi:chloramphenicol O-acetyltransferase